MTGYVYIDLNTKDYGGFVKEASSLLRQKLTLPAGYTWTQVVSAGRGNLLFYNANNGNYLAGTLGADGAFTREGGVSSGWSVQLAASFFGCASAGRLPSASNTPNVIARRQA